MILCAFNRPRPSSSCSSSGFGSGIGDAAERGRGRRTRTRTVGFVALFFVLGFAPVHAQEPRIRASLQLPETVWTGQKVTLVVELLAPGYFSGAASYELPAPAGLLLFPPAEHPTVSGETIDGTYYVIQRHELAVYPATAGPHTIPPIMVRIAYKHAPLDHDSIAATLATPALTLTATAPPGSEGLGQVISARNLQVVEEWKPEPGKTAVKAGDAFTRTITFTAPEVPGMVFPPFPAGKIDGLRLYPKPPVLLDRRTEATSREDPGELLGGRRDTMVYVCERPGRFTLPAVRLTWWDLEAKQLRTADLPARTITVVANPALASTPAVPVNPPPAGWRDELGWWLGGGVALAALILLGRSGARLGRLLAPLRPVHLQPLNPGARPGRPGGG